MPWFVLRVRGEHFLSTLTMPRREGDAGEETPARVGFFRQQLIEAEDARAAAAQAPAALEALWRELDGVARPLPEVSVVVESIEPLDGAPPEGADSGEFVWYPLPPPSRARSVRG